MLKLHGISRSFGSKQVLHNFSLELRPGQVGAICGESGCGKTTALEIIAGLLPPDAGTRDVETKRIGYAFQDDCLVPWLSAKDNLLFVLGGDKETAGKEADRWLESFGLALSASSLPAQLSGGMKRRLNIARALAVNPELLLLDEPFAFQDESNCDLIAGQIALARSQRSIAVLFAAHDVGRRLSPDVLVVLPNR